MSEIKLPSGGNVELTRQTETARIVKTFNTDSTTIQSNETAKAKSVNDNFTVSERTLSISKLLARINELPGVRLERVEALRAKVESDTYRPDATRIAAAMLDAF